MILSTPRAAHPPGGGRRPPAAVSDQPHGLEPEGLLKLGPRSGPGRGIGRAPRHRPPLRVGPKTQDHWLFTAFSIPIVTIVRPFDRRAFQVTGGEVAVHPGLFGEGALGQAALEGYGRSAQSSRASYRSSASTRLRSSASWSVSEAVEASRAVRRGQLAGRMEHTGGPRPGGEGDYPGRLSAPADGADASGPKTRGRAADR